MSSKGGIQKAIHRENTIDAVNICYIPSNLTTGVTSSLGWPHAQELTCVERELFFFARSSTLSRPLIIANTDNQLGNTFHIDTS